MMRLRGYVLSILIFLLLAGRSAFGQEPNTYSPYSRFGFGERVLMGYSSTQGMGGVSQGVRQAHSINFLNAASYTRQDTMSFIFDMGVSTGYYSAESADGKHFRAPQSRINHFSFQVPLQKWGGLAFGFQPYTSVGYDINRYEDDLGLLSQIGRIRYNHRGSGGLNEAYVGLAVEAFRYLSLGMNMRFIFGSINRQQDAYVPMNPLYSDVFTFTRLVTRGFVLSPAFQAHVPFGAEDAHSVVVGGSLDLSMPIRLDVRQDMRVTGVGYDFTIADNRLSERSRIKFPLGYAGGFFYRGPHWSGGMDVLLTRGAAYRLGPTRSELSGSITVAVGASWTPNAFSLRSYAKRIEYMLGGRVSRRPFRVGGHDIVEMQVSAGVGLPFRFMSSRIYVALQAGQRGKLEPGLLREAYVRLHMGVSLNDVWFFKRKYN